MKAVMSCSPERGHGRRRSSSKAWKLRMKLRQLALLCAHFEYNCDDHVHQCNLTTFHEHNLIPVLSLSARLTMGSCWQIEDFSQCCGFYWLHGYELVHVLDEELTSHWVCSCFLYSTFRPLIVDIYFLDNSFQSSHFQDYTFLRRLYYRPSQQ